MIKRILGIAGAVGLGLVAVRAIRQYREDSQFDLAPVGVSPEATAGKRTISPELLEILADPADKGPVELFSDGAGKEWLINRRNGNRYPIEDGIPIMLIEEGEKNRDTSLVAS